MEGTLSYSARHKRSAQDRHAGKHSHAGRRNAVNSLRPDRAETSPAQVPKEQDTHGPQYLGAPTEE